MTTPAAEPKETTAGSLSKTRQSASSTPGVTSPGLMMAPPTPSPSTATAPPPSVDGGSAGVPDPLDAQPGNGTTPSASDELLDPQQVKLGKKPIRDIFRGLVTMAGEFLHEYGARSDAEQQAGVWLFKDEDDAGTIADPAASVVGRHTGGAVVSGDLADAIAGGVALAAYVLKHGLKTLQIRRALRRMPQGMTQPEQPEELQ